MRTHDPNAVKELVQKLCQSSTPLAKSMDYLQEDIENMRKEYKWVAGSSCMGGRVCGVSYSTRLGRITDSLGCERMVCKPMD